MGLLGGVAKFKGRGWTVRGRGLAGSARRRRYAGQGAPLTGFHSPHGLRADFHARRALHGLGLLRRAPVIGFLHAAVALQGLGSWGRGRSGPLLQPPPAPLPATEGAPSHALAPQDETILLHILFQGRSKEKLPTNMGSWETLCPFPPSPLGPQWEP